MVSKEKSLGASNSRSMLFQSFRNKPHDKCVHSSILTVHRPICLEQRFITKQRAGLEKSVYQIMSCWLLFSFGDSHIFVNICSKVFENIIDIHTCNIDKIFFLSEIKTNISSIIPVFIGNTKIFYKLDFRKHLSKFCFNQNKRYE